MFAQNAFKENAAVAATEKKKGICAAETGAAAGQVGGTGGVSVKSPCTKWVGVIETTAKVTTAQAQKIIIFLLPDFRSPLY